jgi:hypothetical protein
MRKQLKDFIEAIGKDAVAIIPAARPADGNLVWQARRRRRRGQKP